MIVLFGLIYFFLIGVCKLGLCFLIWFLVVILVLWLVLFIKKVLNVFVLGLYILGFWMVFWGYCFLICCGFLLMGIGIGVGWGLFDFWFCCWVFCRGLGLFIINWLSLELVVGVGVFGFFINIGFGLFFGIWDCLFCIENILGLFGCLFYWWWGLDCCFFVVFWYCLEGFF